MSKAYDCFITQTNARGADQADGFSKSWFDAMSSTEISQAIQILANLAPQDLSAIDALGLISDERAAKVLNGLQLSEDASIDWLMVFSRALCQHEITKEKGLSSCINLLEKYSLEGRQQILILTSIFELAKQFSSIDIVSILKRIRSQGNLSPGAVRHIARGLLYISNSISGMNDLANKFSYVLYSYAEGDLSEGEILSLGSSQD